MAKHTYYFKHDFNSHNDEKIIDLRMSQGLEGYGAFWFLIELLASAENYILENNYKRLAFSMGTKEEVIKSVVEDFGLFSLDIDDNFWSDSLVERMNRLDEIKLKRAEAGSKGGKSKASAKQVPSKKKASAKQKEAEKRREEESKEDKSKEKEIKIQHLDALFFTDEEREKLKIKYPNKTLLKLGLEKLNNYIMSKGTKYKSHYHVMISWVYDDICGSYVPTPQENDKTIPKATLEQNSARDALAMENINKAKKGK